MTLYKWSTWKAGPSKNGGSTFTYSSKEGELTVDKHSHIADSAFLGGGTRITRSSIDAACIIGGNCVITGSRVEGRVVVGEGTKISGAVIEECAKLGTHCVVEEGARVCVDAMLGNNCILEKGTFAGPRMWLGDDARIKTGAPGWSDSKLFDGETLEPTGQITGGRS